MIADHDKRVEEVDGSITVKTDEYSNTVTVASVGLLGDTALPAAVLSREEKSILRSVFCHIPDRILGVCLPLVFYQASSPRSTFLLYSC